MSQEIKAYTPADMQRLYSPEPKRGVTFVTKKAFPKGFGYLLTFIPPEAELLREHPRQYFDYGNGNVTKLGDFEGPPFIAYDTFIEEYAGTNRFPDMPRFILRVSDAGFRLIKAVGLEKFRDRMFRPDQWGGEEISRGNESIVRKVELAEQPCILKLPETQSLTNLNTSRSAFRIRYSGANYEYYFGTTTQIADILLPRQHHFTSFRLDRSPTEYVAGQGFHLEEYLENICTVADIMNFIHSDKTRDEDSYLGRNKQQWSSWYECFTHDRMWLEDLFFIREMEQEKKQRGEVYKGSLFGEIDLHPSNWLVRSLDEETGIPTLSLIDQNDPRPTPQGGMWDLDMMDRYRRFNELTSGYRNDPLLSELRAIDA